MVSRYHFRLLGGIGILLCTFLCSAGEEIWTEVTSPNFIVISNASQKQARRTARTFEQFRSLIQTFMPRWKVDPGSPLTVFAARDGNSMKDLLPVERQQKGMTQPAGLFQAGPEKNFVLLRIDIPGDQGYHIIYHEYVHMLQRLNFQNLPLWLSEGLAEFFGHSTISDSSSSLGNFTNEQIEVLRNSKLIPLDVLLAELDSKSFMAQYYAAQLAYESGKPEDVVSAESCLRKALAINPRFVPAYRMLSQVLTTQKEKLPEALELAKKAADLEPAALSHQLNVGRVLMAMEKLDEAYSLGQRVLVAARTEADRSQAESFLFWVKGSQDAMLRAKRYAEDQIELAKKMEEQRQMDKAAAKQAKAPAPVLPAKNRTGGESKRSRPIDQVRISGNHGPCARSRREAANPSGRELLPGSILGSGQFWKGEFPAMRGARRETSRN